MQARALSGLSSERRTHRGTRTTSRITAQGKEGKEETSWLLLSLPPNLQYPPQNMQLEMQPVRVSLPVIGNRTVEG